MSFSFSVSLMITDPFVQQALYDLGIGLLLYFICNKFDKRKNDRQSRKRNGH